MSRLLVLLLGVALAGNAGAFGKKVEKAGAIPTPAPAVAPAPSQPAAAPSSSTVAKPSREAEILGALRKCQVQSCAAGTLNKMKVSEAEITPAITNFVAGLKSDEQASAEAAAAAKAKAKVEADRKAAVAAAEKAKIAQTVSFLETAPSFCGKITAYSRISASGFTQDNAPQAVQDAVAANVARCGGKKPASTAAVAPAAKSSASTKSTKTAKTAPVAEAPATQASTHAAAPEDVSQKTEQSQEEEKPLEAAGKVAGKAAKGLFDALGKLGEEMKKNGTATPACDAGARALNQC